MSRRLFKLDVAGAPRILHSPAPSEPSASQLASPKPVQTELAIAVMLLRQRFNVRRISFQSNEIFGVTLNVETADGGSYLAKCLLVEQHPYYDAFVHELEEKRQFLVKDYQIQTYLHSVAPDYALAPAGFLSFGPYCVSLLQKSGRTAWSLRTDSQYLDLLEQFPVLTTRMTEAVQQLELLDIQHNALDLDQMWVDLEAKTVKLSGFALSCSRRALEKMPAAQLKQLLLSQKMTYRGVCCILDPGHPNFTQEFLRADRDAVVLGFAYLQDGKLPDFSTQGIRNPAKVAYLIRVFGARRIESISPPSGMFGRKGERTDFDELIWSTLDFKERGPIGELSDCCLAERVNYIDTLYSLEEATRNLVRKWMQGQAFE